LSNGSAVVAAAGGRCRVHSRGR